MKPSTVAETYNELMGPESRVKSVEIQDDGFRQNVYVNMYRKQAQCLEYLEITCTINEPQRIEKNNLQGLIFISIFA